MCARYPAAHDIKKKVAFDRNPVLSGVVKSAPPAFIFEARDGAGTVTETKEMHG
jgi:hypothetical protein